MAPRDRDRVCENEFPLNKLDLFRFVLNSQKLRQTHSESVHLSSYSCRIVLQTQTSWNGTGKCGRVCTRVSFSENSFLITYKTTLLTLHDYRESQVCAATMIRTCTGKCRNSSLDARVSSVGSTCVIECPDSHARVRYSTMQAEASMPNATISRERHRSFSRYCYWYYR